MKLIFCLLTALCFADCYSQVQKVTYFKNPGIQVKGIDSADFVRVISAPDSGSNLTNVKDYYPGGKVKFIAKSAAPDYLLLEGPVLSFYENGHRMSIANYKEGNLLGDNFEYFPNGKLYLHREYFDHYTDDKNFTIRAAYDSLGNITAENGNGILNNYSPDFSKLTESGPIKNGWKNGLWKGVSPNNITFEETYESGVLIKGTAQKNGKTATYISNRNSPPLFPSGDRALGGFLARTIRYPRYEREANIQGRVILSFTIEEDGKVSNIIVIKSPSTGLSQEAVRTISACPNWIPATEFGFPTNFKYSLPVDFKLDNK